MIHLKMATRRGEINKEKKEIIARRKTRMKKIR